MGSLRQIGAGFLLGVLSIAAVLGGFALSQAETGVVVVDSPTVSPSALVVTVYPTVPLLTFTPLSVDSTSITDTPEPTYTLPASLTPPPPPVSCLPPAGWVAIQIQGYDTLASLAQSYQTTSEAIKNGNCLFSDQLVSGSFLYVPPRPTATFVPCGAPYGWVNYYVVPGDTLYSISARYRVTVADLQRANCLGSSTFIASGKPIKVPNVATSTSSVKTPTWTASPTLTLEPALPTSTLVPPSVTASSIPPAVATQTAAAATQAAVDATQTAVAATQAALNATQTAAAATQAAADAAATQAAATQTAAAKPT
jgi:LysM repeat protein